VKHAFQEADKAGTLRVAHQKHVIVPGPEEQRRTQSAKRENSGARRRCNHGGTNKPANGWSSHGERIDIRPPGAATSNRSKCAHLYKTAGARRFVAVCCMLNASTSSRCIDLIFSWKTCGVKQEQSPGVEWGR